MSIRTKKTFQTIKPSFQVAPTTLSLRTQHSTLNDKPIPVKFGMEEYTIGLQLSSKFGLMDKWGGSNLNFFAPYGQQYKPMKVKFGMVEYTMGPISCQIWS